MAEVQTVSQRARLAVRREPHWHKLGNGQFVGFRKMAPTSGQWQARYRHPVTQKQEYKALGDFGHIRDADRFVAAKNAAEEWFIHLGRGGSTRVHTINDICNEYVNHIGAEKGAVASTDIARRFNQYVIDDVTFANVPVDKLQEHHIRSWLKRLKNLPSKSGPNKGLCRSDSSLNRDITPFRAALNFALRTRMTTHDVWTEALKPKKGADRKRQIILSDDEITRLLKSSPEDLRSFVRALSMIPIRPGAMANLQVKHFDRTAGTLTIFIDKAGAGRIIALPKSTAEFFFQQSKNKLPTAYLFTRENGTPWNRHSWKIPFKQAVTESGINPTTTLYALRHTGITFLIEENVPTLTVAKLTGTSVRIIEQNYGHLTNRMSRSALEKLALR